ncbi:MAG: hypothetical protein Q6K55_05630 [Thermostichus sp. DG02_3_bins_51]
MPEAPDMPRIIGLEEIKTDTKSTGQIFPLVYRFRLAGIPGERYS